MVVGAGGVPRGASRQALAASRGGSSRNAGVDDGTHVRAGGIAAGGRPSSSAVVPAAPHDADEEDDATAQAIDLEATPQTFARSLAPSPPVVPASPVSLPVPGPVPPSPMAARMTLPSAAAAGIIRRGSASGLVAAGAPPSPMAARMTLPSAAAAGLIRRGSASGLEAAGTGTPPQQAGERVERRRSFVAAAAVASFSGGSSGTLAVTAPRGTGVSSRLPAAALRGSNRALSGEDGTGSGFLRTGGAASGGHVPPTVFPSMLLRDVDDDDAAGARPIDLEATPQTFARSLAPTPLSSSPPTTAVPPVSESPPAPLPSPTASPLQSATVMPSGISGGGLAGSRRGSAFGGGEGTGASPPMAGPGERRRSFAAAAAVASYGGGSAGIGGTWSRRRDSLTSAGMDAITGGSPAPPAPATLAGRAGSRNPLPLAVPAPADGAGAVAGAGVAAWQAGPDRSFRRDRRMSSSVDDVVEEVGAPRRLGGARHSIAAPNPLGRTPSALYGHATTLEALLASAVATGSFAPPRSPGAVAARSPVAAAAAARRPSRAPALPPGAGHNVFFGGI